MSVMSGKVATDDPDFNQIKSFSREGADSIECQVCAGYLRCVSTLFKYRLQVIFVMNGTN